MPKTNQAKSTTPQTPNTPPQTQVLFFIDQDSISPHHVVLVETELKKVDPQKPLNVLLNTHGGDVYSAMKIIKVLQTHPSELRILVPEYVYSSGTLMSLSGNGLYMGIHASLGPLDLPMEHPNDGSGISSLDVTQTLTNLTSICTSVGMQIYEELRSQRGDARLGKNTASQLAFDTASKLVAPIIDKIDPFNLQKGFREARIGFYYAIDTLAARMMSKNLSQALESSKTLVNTYPSHGYCIFRDEARSLLKLNVLNLENLQEWNTVISARFEAVKSASQHVTFELL